MGRNTFCPENNPSSKFQRLKADETIVQSMETSVMLLANSGGSGLVCKFDWLARGDSAGQR
jgi:hypothetical protein